MEVKRTNKLVKIRMMLVRSLTYVSIVNFIMLMYLTLSNLKEKAYINFDISKYIVLIWLGVLGILILVGYLDMYVFKVLGQEHQTLFELNPHFVDMKEKIDEIHRRGK